MKDSETENLDFVRAGLNDNTPENYTTSPLYMENDTPKFFNPVQSRTESPNCLSHLCQNDVYSPVSQNVEPRAFAMSWMSAPDLTTALHPTRTDNDVMHSKQQLTFDTESTCMSSRSVSPNTLKPGTKTSTKFVASVTYESVFRRQKTQKCTSQESKPESHDLEERSRKWECGRDKPVLVVLPSSWLNEKPLRQRWPRTRSHASRIVVEEHAASPSQKLLCVESRADSGPRSTMHKPSTKSLFIQLLYSKSMQYA